MSGRETAELLRDLAECSATLDAADDFWLFVHAYGDGARLTLRIDTLDDEDCRCTATVTVDLADVDRSCLEEMLLRLRDSAVADARELAVRMVETEE